MHLEKFNELEVKQHEAEADRKEEQVMKRRKFSETHQLTLKEVKNRRILGNMITQNTRR